MGPYNLLKFQDDERTYLTQTKQTEERNTGCLLTSAGIHMHAHTYTCDNVKGQIWNKPPDTTAARLLSSCQVYHFTLGSIPSAKGPGCLMPPCQ